MTEFEKRNSEMVVRMAGDHRLRDDANQLLIAANEYEYTYHFTWMGRPIIQLPQDIMAVQELIWSVKPDVVIETGVAHGGSLILSASILELIGGDGCVVGIDIDIRPHNRKAIEEHPMAKRISLVEGSSISDETVAQVRELVAGRPKVMVFLDSNHTHEHVLRELELYSPMVTNGSYLVVFDTAVEDMPEDSFPDRPWGRGDNPKTAVHQFLKENDRFMIDHPIHQKLLLTVAPEGFLRCIKD